MTRHLAVAAALALALLAGCGRPAPTAGVVVEKQHVPARDWTDNVPIYTTLCAGKPLICHPLLVGFVPVQRHEAEYWRLELRDDSDPEHLGWVDVPSQTYDRYDIGGHYPDPR